MQFGGYVPCMISGPSSRVELVKAASVDRATIRGIVERLKARGLIDLSRIQADGRKADDLFSCPRGGPAARKCIPEHYLINEKDGVARLNPARAHRVVVSPAQNRRR